MDPVDTFHFPDGTRFAVPADLDVYLARLKEEFPEEAGALDAFFAAVREAYLLGLLHYFRGRPAEQTPRLALYATSPCRQALDRWFRDPKLKLLLTADCPHWGSPPGRTSFVFDSMLRLSYFLGNYYPKGGSQAFADDLARVLRGARRTHPHQHDGAPHRHRGGSRPRRGDRDRCAAPVPGSAPRCGPAP